jgi:hypothetical protein
MFNPSSGVQSLQVVGARRGFKICQIAAAQLLKLTEPVAKPGYGV